MSYNLLLNTEFSHNCKHWTFKNCHYKDGFLIADSTVFSVEQEIVLTDPARLYASFDYICFDKNVKYAYCGICSNNVLEVNKKRVLLRKRKRLSVVDTVDTERIKIVFTFEAKTTNSKIYIDSPLLISLTEFDRESWPRWMLDKTLYYKSGYFYENLYAHGSEIKCTNTDFHSVYTKTTQARIGILASVTRYDWFQLEHTFEDDAYYLVKLDFKELNNYGTISMSYGEAQSVIDDEQMYLVFRGNSATKLRIYVNNELPLPYLINLKNVLITNITKLSIEQDDIKHLPYVD